MDFQSRVIRGHSGPIYDLALDNQFVYSTSSDRFVTRWNLDTLEQDSFAVKLDSPAYCITIHHQTLFIGCNSGTVLAIDLSTKKMKWELNRFGQPVFSLCWSENLNLLLVGDHNGNLYSIHDSLSVEHAGGQSMWYFPLDSGKIRTISEFGTCFYVGSQDGKIRAFQTPSLNEIWASKAHEGSVYTLLKTEKGFLSGGLDGQAVQLSENGAIQKKIPIHYQSVYSIVGFEDGYVSCSKDKTIKVWSGDWKIRKKIEGAGSHLKSVNRLLSYEKGFITASDDKTIRIWNKI